MKKNLSNILLILVLLAGLSLMLYPSFADWWNSSRQSRAIASYANQVANLDADKYAEIWEAARAYNEALRAMDNQFVMDAEREETYRSLLNVGGNGIMGYIEIPAVKVSLPIYHGTAESVLQIAIGHLEWTSLPVGGQGSHCVVSGHRGLPSARLFTDLDRLAVGDIFTMRILDEILTYEVDQILIVEPQNVEPLCIVEGQDLCTLVTCTPYGINTHRLLVRGHRIDNIEAVKAARVTADATLIEPLMVAPIVAAPILLILILAVFLQPKKKSGGDRK